MACSKSCWNGGSFQQAFGLAQKASDLALDEENEEEEDDDDDDGLESILKQGCGINALALTKLAMLQHPQQQQQHSSLDNSTLSEEEEMEGLVHVASTYVDDTMEVMELLNMTHGVLLKGYHGSSLSSSSDLLALGCCIVSKGCCNDCHGNELAECD
eukprot:2556544-Ditylum_brightwellii.AAC.1